jgi:transposase-like protein
MERYPEARREAVIAKMAPPHNKSIAELAREEGISAATLYAWRRRARSEGRLVPASEDSPEGWTARDKFTAVLETAGLAEAEISAYCRRKGLYPAQIARWREACEQANDWDRARMGDLARERRADAARIRELEREVSRKEKALAETAALLVLRKKAAAIWGGEDG